MESIGNHQDKINLVAKYCRSSAAQWYTIIRDQVTTYEDFVNAFEARYWNQHVQRKVRDRLEFGKYVYGRQTKEQYVIQQAAKAKLLRPPLTKIELIHKLAYHFDQNIRVAAMTRG